MMDKQKVNYSHIMKSYLGDDIRPNTGLCMIIFAVPLLIPGITITTVAFQENTSFSRYSGLHIFGMVILAIAVLLLIVGISLRIRFKSKVAPEMVHHAMSTHEGKTQTDFGLRLEGFSSNSKKNSNSAAGFNSMIPPVNYMYDEGFNNSTTAQIVSSTQGAVNRTDLYHNGCLKKEHFVDESFSSDDSSDSEDRSSGSYTITEDTEENFPLRDGPNQVVKNILKGDLSNVHSARTQEHKTGFSLKNLRSILVHSNNFFHTSVEEEDVPKMAETYNYRLNQRLYNKEVLDGSHDNIMKVAESPQAVDSVLPTYGSQTNKKHSLVDIENSPGTRKRLQGLSSDAISPSSENFVGLDAVTVPATTSHTPYMVLSEENLADSNTSVFSKTEESKKRIPNISTTNGRSLDSSDIIYPKIWTKSPYAVEPLSYQIRDRVTKSTIASSRVPSSDDHNITRPHSSEGYGRSEKTLVPITFVHPHTDGPESYCTL